MAKITKTDQQWRQSLSDEQYKVLRQKSTETPFSGRFVSHRESGLYSCVACGSRLFASDVKFDSSSGWPSFYDALPGSVEFKDDTSHGMVRTEVVCANCGGHLGHVFEDAKDQPGGKRYCINSVCLDFKPNQGSR